MCLDTNITTQRDALSSTQRIHNAAGADGGAARATNPRRGVDLNLHNVDGKMTLGAGLMFE